MASSAQVMWLRAVRRFQFLRRHRSLKPSPVVWDQIQSNR